jgi:hypothetical protein
VSIVREANASEVESAAAKAHGALRRRAQTAYPPVLLHSTANPLLIVRLGFVNASGFEFFPDQTEQSLWDYVFTGASSVQLGFLGEWRLGAQGLPCV